VGRLLGQRAHNSETTSGVGRSSKSAFPVWAWLSFTALIAVLLLLGLLVLARGEREISFRQAAGLSVFWIVLALYVALRRISESFMAVATALYFVAIAVYFVSNTVFETLSLSDKYAAATTDAQRAVYLAVGQAMLATFEGTAFHVRYVRHPSETAKWPGSGSGPC
jgi:hypothetical protein